MDNDKVLEDWNEQFLGIDKLRFDEVKELYKKINGTDNQKLKKSYYEKIILGTQHVVYKYLKSTNLHLISSVEIATEDIISTIYEVWIENVKSGKLNEVTSFSRIVQSNSFSYAVLEKFGLNNQFDVSSNFDPVAFYEFGKQHSDNALGILKNMELKTLFVKYYRLRQQSLVNNSLIESIFNDSGISNNQIVRVIDLFDKVSNYLDSAIGDREISNTNLGKYIKLIVGNSIASDFVDNVDLIDKREFDPEIMQSDMHDSLLNSLQVALSEREKIVIRNRFGFDDGRCRTYKEISSKFNTSREVVRRTESKAPRKLRRVEFTNNLE